MIVTISALQINTGKTNFENRIFWNEGSLVEDLRTLTQCTITFNMKFFFVFYFISLIQLLAGSQATVTELSLSSDAINCQVESNKPIHFCHEPSENEQHKLYELIFHDRVIEIATNGSDFPWHSIRGVSKDDAHSHLQDLVFRIFDADETIKPKIEPHEVKSFIRDLVSSCPSPFVSSNRKKCAMRFSVLSKACVTIKLPETTDISVTITESFNNRYVYNLITGLALIIFAHDLAKSKLFQVSPTQFLHNLLFPLTTTI